MEKCSNSGLHFGSAVLCVGLLLAGVYFVPWKDIHWGTIQQMPANTITVVGEAQSQKTNQTASFTAGVNAVNDDKDAAINEVNESIKAIIESVKNFGIDENDIKTQNLNVYQMEESYWEGDRQKSRKGQWRVDNSVQIKLKDAKRASELAQILAESGATNVYGPNFAYDDNQEEGVDTGLYKSALDNAREKADAIARASGKRIKGVVSVVEGVSSGEVSPMLRMESGFGGGGALEPGSTTVNQQFTVVFEME